MQEIIKKADILIEALPYIRAFRGKPVIVKYGGSVMGNEPILKGILEDLVFMSYVGLRPVLVHGGGPEINQRLKHLGRRAEFVDGMRVTDADTIRVVDDSLTDLNKALVHKLKGLGGAAVGMTPATHGVIKARPHANAERLGFVGVVAEVDTATLDRLLQQGAIPVVSPVGVGPGKQRYNINADDAASQVASALRAEKLVLLTDVQGIQRTVGESESLITTLTVGEAKGLIERQVIQAGMIPKVQACVHALRAGVRKTHIINAKTPHALLLEIFTTQGIGTEIVK